MKPLYDYITENEAWEAMCSRVSTQESNSTNPPVEFTNYMNVTMRRYDSSLDVYCKDHADEIPADQMKIIERICKNKDKLNNLCFYFGGINHHSVFAILGNKHLSNDNYKYPVFVEHKFLNDLGNCLKEIGLYERWMKKYCK